MFLNVGPPTTVEFLVVTLLRVAGLRPIDLVVMGATALGSSVAAVVLRRILIV